MPSLTWVTQELPGQETTGTRADGQRGHGRSREGSAGSAIVGDTVWSWHLKTASEAIGSRLRDLEQGSVVKKSNVGETSSEGRGILNSPWQWTL